MHENTILIDLGLIAVTSAFVAVLFHRLRFPVMLGYVMVGLLLGPFLFENSIIRERDNVQSLAEVGVVFLLFGLGMGFDLKRLHQLFGTSMIPLILQTILMLNIGLMVAPMLGFDRVQGIVMGSLLAISSSMVTIGVLQDRKAIQLPHAQLAIGILILEDIIAILLLVVLSGINASSALPWGSSIWSIFILLAFVVAVFYVGRIAMPPILRVIHKIGSLELVCVFAIGTVLGSAILASQFHLSLGLGAFVAGSLFTNSSLTEQLEKSIEPIKELFSAVFFVSVGMLIDPAVITQQLPVILLLSVLVVLGKTASCGVGLFLSGEKSLNAFRASLAKSQIGEFSFVIATLAQSMGLADERLVSVVVGVSFVTIFTTPLFSRYADTLYGALNRLTPRPVSQAGSIYHRFFCSLQASLSRTAFFLLVKRPFWQIFVAFFLISGVIILASLGSRWTLTHATLSDTSVYLIPGIWLLSAMVVTPFLLSILRNLNAISIMLVDLVFQGAGKARISSTLRNFVGQLLSILLLLLVSASFLAAITTFLPTGVSLMLFVLLIAMLALVFRRQMILINSELEHRFTSSFREQSKAAETRLRMQALDRFNREFDWNSLTTEKIIPPNSMASGKQIAEIGLREKAGATIIAIARGDAIVYDPNPMAHLFAGDKLVLLGNSEQISQASALLDLPQIDTGETDQSLRSEAVYIEPGCFLEGNTLAGSELRTQHGITVVGIQHGKEPVRDPSPSEMLHAGDVLLVMGKRHHVDAFKETLYQSSA